MATTRQQYQSPSDVLRLHPEITWNAQQVGWLFALGLVRGQRVHHSIIVDPEDVVDAYRMRKDPQHHPKS